MKKQKMYWLIGLLMSMATVENWSAGQAWAIGEDVDAELAAPFQVQYFDLSQVRLLDGPFQRAMEHNSEWLLSLEPDRFLAWFRKEAGLEPKGEVYGGWESQSVAGHSLGHYMSACAMMYAATGEPEYKKRTDYIVDELALVQETNGDGYMSAFPNGRQAMAEVKRGEIRSAGFDLNGIWVPWYTQHKLMAGLSDIYRYTQNPKALAVWKQHADWIESIVGGLTEEQWQKMLDCEHGGMNESFAELYSVTGDERYLTLAQKFYHKRILEPLSRRENSLIGVHANTQVPKAIGAARIYEVTGLEKFHTIANYFWDTVVHHFTYANGGNSAGEYFGRPDILGERMNDTTETCNTYNMLKLTRHLYSWDPQASYMDYYECALLNHILTHQHPDRGGALVYKGFLDMPARKGYSHPTESFWCCVGTGMENHTKYANTIFAYAPETLYVNLFISAELNWSARGITVRQKTELPTGEKTTLTFRCEKPTRLTLKVRQPAWAKTMTLAVKSQPQDIMINTEGYLTLTRTFKDGDIVTLTTPLELHVATLPDRPDRTAFLYGPTLLATVLKDGQKPPSLVSEKAGSILAALKPAGPLRFTSETLAYQVEQGRVKPCSLEMIPLYQIADQPYTVYMDVFTPQQWEQEKEKYAAEQERLKILEAASTDILYLGQMQPERDHNLTSEQSGAGQFMGRKWRDSYEGWFEFDMKVDPDKAMDLICTYWGSDGGQRRFDIMVDGTKIATQILNNNKPGEFFDVTYALPEKLTRGKTKVRVRAQALPGNIAGGMFEARTIRRGMIE